MGGVSFAILALVKLFTYGLSDGDLTPKNIGGALVAVINYLLSILASCFGK